MRLLDLFRLFDTKQGHGKAHKDKGVLTLREMRDGLLSLDLGLSRAEAAVRMCACRRDARAYILLSCACRAPGLVFTMAAPERPQHKTSVPRNKDGRPLHSGHLRCELRRAPVLSFTQLLARVADERDERRIDYRGAHMHTTCAE